MERVKNSVLQKAVPVGGFLLATAGRDQVFLVASERAPVRGRWRLVPITEELPGLRDSGIALRNPEAVRACPTAESGDSGEILHATANVPKGFEAALLQC